MRAQETRKRDLPNKLSGHTIGTICTIGTSYPRVSNGQIRYSSSTVRIIGSTNVEICPSRYGSCTLDIGRVCLEEVCFIERRRGLEAGEHNEEEQHQRSGNED